MMVQLILFSLYTTTIIAIHFEKDQTTGWLMAVGGFIVLSAFVVEPLLLLVLYYYEIKYHPASELNIEPRVKEKSDVVQEDVNEEPHKIPDVAQEPFFEDVSGGQDAEDDISSVPQRHAFGADMVHPLIDPSTVQVHRNEAVDPNADVQYAPEDLPPQEPLPISPNQEAPGVQRPDTPIRAQTPFRAQTPAVGLTGLSPIGIPAVPNFGIIPEETHDQLRTSYAEPEVAKPPLSPMNVVYPQSPPQTPPAAAVAMAEIQRMRQELAKAKARAAEQTGSLGAELGRLAPLRNIAQGASAAHRLSGLQAGRGPNAGRQGVVRGLALPSFGRNNTMGSNQSGLAPIDSQRDRPAPKFGLPPLGQAPSRPLPPELSNLAPTNRSTGSNGSGGLSALPRDSARRFSRRSGGSGEGTGRFSNRSRSKSPKRQDDAQE